MKGGDNMNEKRKHLSIHERIKIQMLREQGYSLSYIAKELGFNKSSISREIKRNMNRPNSGAGSSPTCLKSNRCKDFVKDTIYCRYQRGCSSYIPCICKNLKMGKILTCKECGEFSICNKKKTYYIAIDAQDSSIKRNKVSRKGPNYSKEEVKGLDKLISPLVLKGQSLYHIIKTNNLVVSEMTIRRWIDKGYFKIGRYDLIRAYKRSPVKDKTFIRSHKKNKDPYILDGRLYSDYLEYLNITNESSFQVDTVIGKKVGDRYRILTIYCIRTSLMFGLLIRNKHLIEDTNNTLINLFKTNNLDYKVRSLVCDNGIEFNRIYEIEKYIDIKTFYADPMNSNQKSELERSHEYIRYIIPKGTSFNSLTTDKLNLMFSHINSFIRKSLGDTTPIERAIDYYGTKFIRNLKLDIINPKEIILNKSLLD